ncbi:tRNA dihydrouridine(20/20a) synthase DusA [Parvibaculaceae bacterium PLY_AMNH_Bact1]|nr:tRNA dihydrouridine(20/20a) synthase DusA [Parvibaculaceae bacterium PLY_AMNH_Bact1]
MSSKPEPNRRFSVAPMMEWTDRHDRFFLRLISQHALLYTEMVTAPAIIHGKRDYLLGFDDAEHPVAVQLGGSDQSELTEAARISEDYGYEEINLNVGCPSDRVQSGRFGACLMKEPDLVADCVAAMVSAVKVPVTVKCRIGVDDQDPRVALPTLIEKVRDAGCRTVIVHARKAWLEGLSPKENRTVPPLDYDLVYEMKRAYPDLEICINGGVTTLDETEEHLAHVDGVMMGRMAYERPYVLADVDQRLFESVNPAPTRHEVIEAFLPYMARRLEEGVTLHAMTRHILGLFQGMPGARAWRRHISENAYKKGADISVVTEALSKIQSKAIADPSGDAERVGA